MRNIGVLLVAMLFPWVAHASTWQKCDLDVRVFKIELHQVHAEVLRVKSLPNVECPAIGDYIAFTPNTRDWQGELPRRLWPKVGAQWKVRYQYLDAFCHNESQGDGNCRIKNYPVLK